MRIETKKTKQQEDKSSKAIVCARLIMDGQRLNFGKDKELERLTGVALEALMERSVYGN